MGFVPSRGRAPNAGLTDGPALVMAIPIMSCSKGSSE